MYYLKNGLTIVVVFFVFVFLMDEALLGIILNSRVQLVKMLITFRSQDIF